MRMIVNIARDNTFRLNLTIHFSLFRGFSATIEGKLAPKSAAVNHPVARPARNYASHALGGRFLTSPVRRKGLATNDRQGGAKRRVIKGDRDASAFQDPRTAVGKHPLSCTVLSTTVAPRRIFQSATTPFRARSCFVHSA